MTTAMAERTESPDTHVVPEKPSYEDINTPVIILVGVISSIVTFMIIALVQGMCYHWENSKIRARSNEVVSMPARQYIDEQKKILAGGDGIISIDDAMKKVIEEFGSK